MKFYTFLVLQELKTFSFDSVTKIIRRCGSKMVVTTDSSTPDRSVVYGMYYTGFSLKKGNFEYVSLP